MNEFRDTPVLVTGGTGFIGSHLVQRLAERGARVHLLARPGADNQQPHALGPHVALHPGDVTDLASIQTALDAAGASVVFHLAGDTSVRRLGADLSQLDRSVRTNLQGTLNVVQAAHRSTTVSRVVRTGGLEEYGSGPVPYCESQREQPVSPYSASQVAATHYCQMLQPHVDCDLVTLRLALVYGPGQSPNFFIPSLITALLDGERFAMTSGEQGRDLLYVDDVVEAILRAATTSGLGGAVLNVCSGREYRMRDVAAMIQRVVGKAGLLEIGVAQERDSEIAHLVGSNEQAESLLSWTPEWTLEDGLDHTIVWYRRHAARFPQPDL